MGNLQLQLRFYIDIDIKISHSMIYYEGGLNFALYFNMLQLKQNPGTHSFFKRDWNHNEFFF